MAEKSAKPLIIFNGDCTCDAWRRAGGTGDFLVWRENYLEGPLPADSPLEDFEAARAAFLHRCVPEYREDRLYDFLLSLDRRVLALTARDTVLLHFDCCMYDMVMLARILFLMKDSRAEVRLHCEASAFPSRDGGLYRREPSAFPRLTRAEIAVFAAAWDAILHGAARVAAFNRSGKAEPLPFLAEAMRRYEADHPADGGMGETLRRLCALVCEERLAGFPEIFRAFNAREKYPFMGDTMCQRLLDELAARGLLQKAGTPDAPRYLPAKETI